MKLPAIIFVAFLMVVIGFSTVLVGAQSPCAGSVIITDTSQADPATILVIANSPQANYTVTGPATYRGSGRTFVHQNVSPGTYTITWGAVAGCETSPPETKTTDARGSVVFAGNYKDITTAPRKQTGEIIVNISAPLKADFTISGPEESKIVKAASSFMWSYAPIGTYTIIYGKADWGGVYGGGFTPPPSESKILEPDGTVVFTGTYTEVKPKVEPVPKTPLPTGPPPSPSQIEKPERESTEKTQVQAQEQRELNKPSEAIQSQPPKGFFGKMKNAVSSFFSKIFSIFWRRPSPPEVVPAPPVVVPLSENNLQGMWKIEKLYSGSTEVELKEMPLGSGQTDKYTEFRSDKVCIDGSLNADGEPIPCANYSPLTVSGNKLSFPQPNGVAVNGTWTVTKGRLELNLTITQGSQIIKFRTIYTKLDRPFSTKPAPKAIPVRPLRPVPAEQPIR